MGSWIEELQKVELFLRKWNGTISLIILIFLSVYAVWEIHSTTFDNLRECSQKYSELYSDYIKLYNYYQYGDIPIGLKSNASYYNYSIVLEGR